MRQSGWRGLSCSQGRLTPDLQLSSIATLQLLSALVPWYQTTPTGSAQALATNRQLSTNTCATPQLTCVHASVDCVSTTAAAVAPPNINNTPTLSLPQIILSSTQCCATSTTPLIPCSSTLIHCHIHQSSTTIHAEGPAPPLM